MSYTGNSVSRTFTVGTSVVQVQDVSDLRASVIWSGVMGGRITLSTRNDVTDTNGIIINQGDPPFRIDRALDCCMIRQPLFAIANFAGVTLTKLETLLADLPRWEKKAVEELLAAIDNGT